MTAHYPDFGTAAGAAHASNANLAARHAVARATENTTRKDTEMSEPEAHVRPTEYTVNCLPEDDLDNHVFAITVAYRGRGRWAITRHGSCLSVDGRWDWEMQPSSREDGWLDAHRFDLETALKLAKEAAPHVTVNGHTVADALARTDGSAPR